MTALNKRQRMEQRHQEGVERRIHMQGELVKNENEVVLNRTDNTFISWKQHLLEILNRIPPGKS